MDEELNRGVDGVAIEGPGGAFSVSSNGGQGHETGHIFMAWPEGFPTGETISPVPDASGRLGGQGFDHSGDSQRIDGAIYAANSGQSGGAGGSGVGAICNSSSDPRDATIAELKAIRKTLEHRLAKVRRSLVHSEESLKEARHKIKYHNSLEKENAHKTRSILLQENDELQKKVQELIQDRDYHARLLEEDSDGRSE